MKKSIEVQFIMNTTLQVKIDGVVSSVSRENLDAILDKVEVLGVPLIPSSIPIMAHPALRVICDSGTKVRPDQKILATRNGSRYCIKEVLGEPVVGSSITTVWLVDDISYMKFLLMLEPWVRKQTVLYSTGIFKEQSLIRGLPEGYLYTVEDKWHTSNNIV